MPRRSRLQVTTRKIVSGKGRRQGRSESSCWKYLSMLTDNRKARSISPLARWRKPLPSNGTGPDFGRAQVLLHIGGRHQFGDEVTLRFVATKRSQHLNLGFRFDAFRDHHQTQVVSEVEDERSDRQKLPLSIAPPAERARVRGTDDHRQPIARCNSLSWQFSRPGLAKT